MADIVIYGPSASTYVRTARLACVEKGVSHELTPVELGSEVHTRLHPFRRIPAMQHGLFLLYETGAIARYVDRAFSGPALQPADLQALARMDQWISAISDYCYQTLIREIVIQRVLVPMQGGKPDEAMIKAAWPKAEHQFAVLDAALAEHPYLAGAGVTLADLFLAPILFYAKMQPEAGPLLGKCKNLSAWFDRMAARPSFAGTMPELRGA
ncbi:MAG: glutathione S-transferase family protein [Rhodospirillaceae bacterium]|nr:glutathione S-transferase family protein [Rhodospirillaceae bacterium]